MLVEELRRARPDARFFGCTGPRMRNAGVEPVVDAASLAVVGLVEVVSHLPAYLAPVPKAGGRGPRAAAPGRHPHRFARFSPAPGAPAQKARCASGLPGSAAGLGLAEGRIAGMRRTIDRLLCIFPFEEEFFRDRGLPARYIGHPLAGLVRPALEKAEFFRKHRLAPGRPLVTVLPGSRRGEAARHLPALLDAVERIYRQQATHFLLPASATTGAAFFRERIQGAPIQVIEGESWDAMAHADLALAASGTVTVEAALFGTPMVTFYKVNALSWLLGTSAGSSAVLLHGELDCGTCHRARADAVGYDRRAAGGERSVRCCRTVRPAAHARQTWPMWRGGYRVQGGAMEKAAALVEQLMEGQAAHVS